MTAASLSHSSWLLLIAGAFLIGMAKTAFGGAGALAVLLFAAVVPAKESTGALLPLLLLGDLIAVRIYRQHANWVPLTQLLAGVIPGLVVGVVFLSLADDESVRRCIGATLVSMSVLSVVPRDVDKAKLHQSKRVKAFGSLTLGGIAGFATMTANAAGPVTSIYFARSGMPMLQTLGTGAWFYLAVNIAKAPLSVGAGLITVDSLVLDALLVPGLVLGALAGVRAVRYLNQTSFEWALVLTAFFGGVLLLV